MRKAAPTWAMLAAPLVFLALFLVYPLSEILRASFVEHGDGLAGFRPLWEDSYFLERAWFTTWQAAVSTALALALAMPCAWVLATRDFPGKAIVAAIATVPFVLPTIVVAVAFTALVGPTGVVNEWLMDAFGLESPPIDLLNTLWIILIAHVFYNFAVAARIIAASWSGLDPRLDDAAALLGASRWERFRTVTLPLLRPTILGAGSLVFLFCFTSFGVVLILGGPQYSTIETEIYRETVFLFRLPVAASLAVLQIAFTFVVIAVYSHYERTASAPGLHRRRRAGGSLSARVATGVVVAGMLLLTLAPLAALAVRSFDSGSGYTFDYYRALDDNVRGQILFVTPLTAIRNSLAFATLTVLLAVPMGTLVAYGTARLRRRSALVEALLYITLGVSAVTLGLGFLVALDQPPLDLRSSWVIVVIAHTLIAYPFVARAISGRLRSMDPRVRDAARVLGASPARVFLTVDLPLLRPALLVAVVLAFAVSMGEFGATLLIARPEWPTIPIAIYRYLGQPGALNYGQALAMSTILMAVTATGFLAIDHLRGREAGGF